MNALPRRSAARGGPALVLVSCAAGLALAIRCIGLDHRGLWYDELLSANFIAHGPAATLLTVLRFDVHPPLYYLQLSLWGMAGHGDLWLMANSILWSAAAVLLLGLAAAREYGPRVGLLAAGLAAVSPAALAYSDQVRMYAFLSVLMVWVWQAQTRWLEAPSRRALALMAISQLCVVYSHAIGLFMLGGPILLTGWSLWRAGERRRLLRFIRVEALIVALALPVVALGFGHHVGHPSVPTPSIVLSTWTVLAGASSLPAPLAIGVGVVALALLVAAALTPGTRAQALSLVFAPLLLAAAISYALKPVWLDRIFIPTAPFIALVLARLALQPGPRGRRRAGLALVGLLGALWLSCGLASQIVRGKGDGYAVAARALAGHVGPGDVVASRDFMHLWAFLWAAEGDRWGDPLHTYVVAGPWSKATRLLPGPIKARIAPTQTVLPLAAGHAEASDPLRPWPDPQGDLIVLAEPGEAVAPPGRSLAAQAFADPVRVERWRRTGAR